MFKGKLLIVSAIASTIAVASIQTGFASEPAHVNGSSSGEPRHVIVVDPTEGVTPQAEVSNTPLGDSDARTSSDISSLNSSEGGPLMPLSNPAIDMPTGIPTERGDSGVRVPAGDSGMNAPSGELLQCLNSIPSLGVTLRRLNGDANRSLRLQALQENIAAKKDCITQAGLTNPSLTLGSDGVGQPLVAAHPGPTMSGDAHSDPDSEGDLFGENKGAITGSGLAK